ncbi:MAG: hypothetical protein DRI98_12145 [Bacteroidetes bacterium]|nr:MAG: hypothetical protein DRI98_12145 [Bacteroidota bacterium]
MKYLVLAALLLSGCTYGPQTITESSFEHKTRQVLKDDKVQVISIVSTTTSTTKEADFKELSVIDGTYDCLWVEDRADKLDTILVSIFSLKFMECVL